MNRSSLIYLALPILITAACAGRLPVPTAADADRAGKTWPGITLAELGMGRRLYVDHCSGCHSLYLPSALPSFAWPSKVDEMRERAKLKVPDAEAVVRYLVALTPVAAPKDVSASRPVGPAQGSARRL